MSQIDLILSTSSEGLVSRIVSKGHAHRKGADSIPCALVSAQLRSFGFLSAGKAGLKVRGRIDGPGHFEIEMIGVDDATKEWYRGIGDSLIRNLSDFQVDFPNQIHMTIETGRQET